MSKNILIILVILIVAVGVFYLSRGYTQPPVTADVSGSNSASTTPTPVKFADTSQAAKAVQIYPGQFSDAAKIAMNGFSMQTNSLADGSVEVALTSTNPEYKNQKYAVKPGYTLFFIEKSSGDDAVDNNSDSFLADDTAVLVDDQGFLVQP